MKNSKILALALGLLFSSTAFAGGFTWIEGVFHVPHGYSHVATFILIAILLILVGFLYRAKVNKVSNVIIPDSGITLRNIIEFYGDFIYKQCKQVIGEDHADDYFPFIASTFLFIFISNLIGLIPGFLPPTEYLSTTLALGVFSFVFYNIQGMKVQGVGPYIAHFAGPLLLLAPLIFPIEVISNLIRPLSLALRLRSNMMGDHIVLTQFSNLVPLFVPIIFMVLGLLVSFIQAYVFTVLTMVYINLAVSHHDHDEEHAH